MNSNSVSSATMLRAAQSSLDPNSADYYPQSQQPPQQQQHYRLSNTAIIGGMNGSGSGMHAAYGGVGGNPARGGVYGVGGPNQANALYGGARHNNTKNSSNSGAIASPYYANNTIAGGGMAVYGGAVGGRMGGQNRGGGSSSAGGATNVHGVVYSQHAVNHVTNPTHPPSLQQGFGGYGGTSAVVAPTHRQQPTANHSAVASNSLSKTTSDVFEQFTTPTSALVGHEWAGETPKISPAAPEVHADQLQSIFAQLLSADGTPTTSAVTPTSTPNTQLKLNTPSLGALGRGEATTGAAFAEAEVDLSSLIAHLPTTNSTTSGKSHKNGGNAKNGKNSNNSRFTAATASIGSRYGEPARGVAASNVPSPDARGAARPPSPSVTSRKYTSSIVELVEESPPIHISANAFVPTPEVSPSMAPSRLPQRVGASEQADGAADRPEGIHTSSYEGGVSSAGYHPAPSPSLTSALPPSMVALGDGDDLPVISTNASLSKPNMASLLQGNHANKPAAPPPGSMAEKLMKSASTAPPPATASTTALQHQSTGSITLTAPGPKAPTGCLPATKAGVEKFLRDGDAPETLRHIKILAFSHDYPTEIKALFELWAGNGIPPPDDAFGAYYWYVRKKIGRDLCMKHNGPGKAPGVGYGGCDYANRGQGQCRYHHQCLFCTKEDHGWFDEQKCGRYKTYQKELAKLKLTEDDVYALVANYCK